MLMVSLRMPRVPSCCSGALNASCSIMIPEMQHFLSRESAVFARFLIPFRYKGMRKRANNADSLDKKCCISGIIMLQDAFKAPEQQEGTLGIRNDTISIYFSGYTKMTFN